MTNEMDPVASAQELLNALPEAGLDEHADLFEAIHRSLTDALGAIDNL